jgi:3-methyladenine DNA glycosylase AlkD
MSTEKEIDKIINDIKRLRNGELVSFLSQSGIFYKIAYGVTIPELKEIAQSHYGNHPLAMQLFEQEIRECKILASMIDDPSMVTGEQIDTWAQSFTNHEIVEQVCSNLFWKSEYALSRSMEWCLSGDELLQKGGLIIAARAASNQGISDSIFEPYIEIIENFDDTQISQNKSTTAFTLRQIASRSNNLNTMVLNAAKQMSESVNEHRAWVGNQLIFELDDMEG